MPEPKITKGAPVPLRALSKFEKLDGMPLQVISELFARSGMPADQQEAFWQEAKDKDVKMLGGSVSHITTYADGSVKVSVTTKIGDQTWEQTEFRHPGDMTDAQLDEFKAARNHNFEITVWYQIEEDGDKPIFALTVTSRKPI